MFKKIIVNGTSPTAFLAAAAIVKSAEADSKKPVEQHTQKKDSLAHYKCKPSDLPLYAPLHSLNEPEPLSPKKNSIIRGSLECGFRAVRVEIQSASKSLENQKQSLNDFIAIGREHSMATINTLREPSNTFHRIGAIAAGGISGLILGARGGFFKKLIYSSIGAGGMASVCYPKQASEYSKEALVQARKPYAIAYNFIHGIKPGDRVPIDPVSKFPTSVGEVTDMLSDMYNSAKDALFSSKK